MNKIQAQQVSNKLGLGEIEFEIKISKNGGHEFEVGYVYDNSNKELFVKRQPFTSENSFYLCNQYRVNKHENYNGIN